jgi:hypothetical protein
MHRDTWPPDHYQQDRPAYADSFDGYQQNQWPNARAGQDPYDGYYQAGYEEQPRYDPPPRYNEPPWSGEQQWYPEQQRYDEPQRYDEQNWYDGQQRYDEQPGYGEQQQAWYPEQPGYGGPEQYGGQSGGGRHHSARVRGGRGDGPGVIAGAVMGFLAAGVAIGVATLAAAFFRPAASPIIAVGEAFIDRTPPALKNFAVEKFGENDKTMLLLGMYVTIALLAMAIGVLARRRVMIGIIGVTGFGLFGAFVAYTRPASRPSDVIPSIIGGIAGVLALLWLANAATTPEV